MLQIYFHSKEEIPYTGPELSPHFILKKFSVRGTALVAFIGPCQVQTEHMVDWEDRLAEDRIQSKKMIHFLGEFFGANIREMVFYQRLLIATFQQSLNRMLRESTGNNPTLNLVSRSGDDLFWAGRNLSVSIVTASPVSQLLHIGINIDPTGAPVAAVGLDEMQIHPVEWITSTLKEIQEEWDSVEWACAKVRPVI